MALTKITTSVIAANTLGTANIADNSIDATKIAANSILTRHIDDDQITGDQLADDITIAGNLTITGNLTTNGASVTNSSSNTTIEDAIIELGTGTSGAPATDAGIVIERGSSDNVFIGWDESADKVTVGTGSFTGASTGNLTITAAPFVSGALTASGISYPTSDGTNGQVLKTDGSGSLTFGDNTTKVDNYTATGDGSTTAFDTGINPGSEVNTWIFIDGVYQQKSEYSYSGSTVTFTTAPQNGASIDVITGTSSNITASDTVLGVYEATTTNTDTYATGISASNENNTWVFVGGVYQPKDSYTFSSGTLTFDANTPTGQKLSVVATKTITAGAVDTSTLAANAVTSAKIASNSILSRHIANNSIVGADISATTQITASTFTGALTGNVTGNVAGNLTGTIQTAAQTNITSVGTLSALTVSGQLTAGGLSYPTSDGTNEQVLRTDGSGNLSFGTISGTTLNNNTNNYVMTGTGTANTLNGESGLTYDGSTLAVTGDANFDSNTLFVDASANNVGIGLTTPTDKLDVAAPNSQFRLTDTDDSTFTQFSSSGGKLAIRQDSTSADHVFLNASGNVGIGTSSPSTDLHVVKASTTLPTIAADTVGILESNGTAALSIISGTGNSVIRFGDSADENIGQIRYVHASDKLDFITNTNVAMAIDSSGNVGIGTSSPGSILDIRKTNSGGVGPTLSLINGASVANGNAVDINMAGNPGGGALAPTGRIRLTEDASAIPTLGFHLYDGSSLGERMTLRHLGSTTLKLSGYASMLRLASGAGAVFGHNVEGSSNANEIIQSNTGYYGSFIKMYYNQGIAFHTMPLAGTTGDVIDSPSVTGTERMRILSDGEIVSGAQSLIDTYSPLVNGLTSDALVVARSATQGSLGLWRTNTHEFKFYSNAYGYMMTFASNGVMSGDFNDTSDRNLKENITDLSGGLSVINQLQPRNFDWKKEEPLDYEMCENMNDEVGMVGLLTWLLSSNRVKGVKIL